MFVDVVEITVKAGNGGDGAVSFHRDKYTAYGGPDGGNGGRGGSIIFVADSNLSTLSNFRYKKRFFAQNGQNGTSDKKSGKKGEDLIIKVPFGTLIKDADSNKILCDVYQDKHYVISRGGRGGAGNMNFSTSTRQSPKFAKPGEETKELNLKLELKLLADVGLIGYPNVGKSTIITMCSGAKPQIANYHFTTLSPKLGIVKYSKDVSFVMADIPGLIEGAWKGVGLGHKFLRHIERCRMLVHIVDVSGCEGRDPIKDFECVNEELKKFNSDLLNRPMLVVGNKCDISKEENINIFKRYVESKGYMYISVAAASNTRISDMLDLIVKKLICLPPVGFFSPDENFERHFNDKLEIKNKNGVFYVNSMWLKKLIKSVNFDDYDSMNYFQSSIAKSGLTDDLKNMGVQEGDIINVDGIEFEFYE